MNTMKPASRSNMARSIWREEAHSADLKQQNSERIETVETSNGRIDTFVQQNSPVNNELIRNSTMNELYGQEINGQLTILPTEVTVREKHGRITPVISMCSFSYDDDVDLEILNRNGRYKITGYDRRVYNAVGTLWLNGRRTISLTEIFVVMNGYAKANPSSRQLQAVEKSLTKLKSIKFYIDLTEEVKANIIKDKDVLVEAGILKSRTDKIKSAVIEDNMLHYRVGTITSEQGKVFKSIQIVGEPSLLTYNRAKGTLLSIPMEYIGLTESNATEKTIAFQDYLLMRIIGYKNGKLRENKILYDTLYRDSGIERPELSKDFIRDRETVRKLLEEWKKKGLINGYGEVKEGRSYVGVVVYIDTVGEIEEEHRKSGE